MTSLRSRAGILRGFALATALGISAFFYACDRITPIPKGPPTIESRVPGGNELYVFPHGRLEMTGFEALRSAFPGVTGGDLAKIAMGSQWLSTKLRSGKSATLEETTQCVRALYPPAPVSAAHARAIHLASDRFGFASLDLLRQSLDDAARGWAIEWNPSLAREYGIPIAKP